MFVLPENSLQRKQLLFTKKALGLNVCSFKPFITFIKLLIRQVNKKNRSEQLFKFCGTGAMNGKTS